MFGIWLLLVIYRNPYANYKIGILDLTYNDFERSNQGPVTYNSMNLETVHVRHMLDHDIV